MANIDQIAIMATMACLYLSLHRADIGVYAKNRKNADQLWKRNFKIYGQNKINLKVKTISFVVWSWFGTKKTIQIKPPKGQSYVNSSPYLALY